MSQSRVYIPHLAIGLCTMGVDQLTPCIELGAWIRDSSVRTIGNQHSSVCVSVWRGFKSTNPRVCLFVSWSTEFLRPWLLSGIT